MVDAGINVGSSLKNINEEIKAIAKHPSLQKLNLSVSVDKSFVKAMNEFASATKVLSTALEQQQKVINESIVTTKKLDGSIEKVTQKQLTNGSIITQNTKKINEESKAYSEQKKTLQDLSKELNGYTLASSKATKNKLGEVTGSKNTYANDKNQKVTVNLDNAGNVKNYSELTNYLKQKEETIKKSETLDKAHYHALQEDQARKNALINKNLKEEEQRNQQFLAQLRTRFAEEQKIARDRDALDKAHAAAMTENLNRKKAVADMEAKISAAQSKFKNNSSAVAELNALNAQLKDVGKVSNYKNALTELQTKLTQITSQARLAGGEAKTLGQRFGDAASKVALWTGATTSVYTVIRALREMTSVIIQVDSQMTQLKRVMDESTDFEGMLSRSIQLANELGRSITEVNENAIGFARMGFDEDQTMNLAKTTTLLQNISELTPGEAVDTLTAAMTIYNVEASKSIEIANKLNEIDNNYAITTQNLALSLTKAGAAGNTFGVSMEKLLGDTTAITTATRESGAVVGNSLKAIYSRLTTMKKSEGVLAKVGISMRDMSGEVKDVPIILDELAGKWNGLSKEQQQYTAVQLAGTWQLTRFLALMQNYNISLSATETALHSQGSAARENEKYMQSLEARIAKMKTAWETMSIAFGNAIISDSIVVLTSLFASMMNGVASLVETVGALPVVLGVVGSGLVLLRASFKLLLIDIVNTVRALFNIAPSAATASAGLRGLTVSSQATAGGLRSAGTAATFAKTALLGLRSATLVGLGFSALGLGLEWIIGLFSDTTKATEDFTDKTEELNQNQYDLSNLKSLSKEYDELSKKTELSFEEKSKLAQIESELSSKYNVTTTNVDGQTKSLQENNKAIQSQIALKEEDLKASRLAAELDYTSNSVNIEKDIESKRDALINQEKKYNELLAEYEQKKSEAQQFDPVTDKAHYDWYQDAIKDLAGRLKEESDLLTNSKTEMQTAMNAKVLAFKGAGQSFVDEQEANNVKIEGLTRGFLDIYAAAAAESGVSSDEFKKNIGDVFSSIQGEDIANAEEGMKLLEDMPGITNLTATSFKNLQAVLSQYTYAPVVEGVESVDDALNSFNLTMEETVERTDEMSQKISETATFVSETKKEIDILNTAQSELANGNRLSTDTIKKMNDKYGDFIKVTGLSKEAIKKYVAAKKEERISIVNDEIAKTKTTIEETKKRITAYEIEMVAWERRRKVEASAKIKEINSQLEAGLITEQQAEQMFGAYRRNQSGIDSNGNIINNSTISDYAMERAALKDLMADLSLLESARTDLTTAANDSSKATKDSGKATKDATKSNDKSNESYSETNEVLTDLQKKLQNVESAIDSLHNKQKSLEQGSAAYRKSIMEENKLLERKAKLLEEGIADPSKLVSYKVTTTSNTSGESYSGKYDDIINKYASENGVDPRLVAAIIQTESTFNPNAKSGAGAMGLMQLMPKTAKGLGVKNAYDPEQNIAGGTKHIADLLKKYNGNVEYALAAYNAGSGNVNKWIKKGQMGNIPFSETKAYAPKVLANYNSISGTSSSSTSASSSSGSGKSNSKLDTMINAALNMQGQFKYQQVEGKFKGTFEDFKKRALADCSQFVQEFFEEFMDITLPRTAAQQSQQGTAVAKKDLKKGDLIFFETKDGHNASHVGIYTGNSKFIQMGTESGLSEQSLNSSYWAPKYRSARRIDGVGESTTSSDGKASTKTSTKAASESDKAQAKADAKKDLEEIRTEQRENQFKLIDDWVLQYSNAIEKVQNKIDKSSNKQSVLYVNSDEWRKEEQSQISLIGQQRKLREEEIKKINELMKQKKITSQDYNKQIAEIETQMLADEAQIYAKRENVIESFVGSYNDKLAEQDHALSLSEANLKGMTEGSVEYNKELRNQIPIIEEKNRIVSKEIDYIKYLLSSGKLNADQTVKYNKLLKELNLSLLDTNSAMTDVNNKMKELKESAIDNIIEEYKKVIEQQRDLALDAIDKEREKEDKRHEERTKNIDDEQKQFDDYINARLKALDREYASDDHEEELAKKTKDRNKILSDINDLSLDDSIEADAKRKALKEQLASVEEEISKFQRDRERELIKQGLQDQLDSRKDVNDKIKDEEDKKHQDALDKLDDEKKKTEQKYKDILEDQKYFYDLKKGLMSEDATVVTATLGIIGGEYDKLFANMKTHIFETSKEMQNLVYQFQQSQDAFNKFKGGDYSAPEPGSSNSETEKIKGTMASRKAWTEYLNNKQSAESIKNDMKKLDKSSAQYKNLENDFNKLKTNNDQLRSVYGFPDGSFKDLVSQKIFSAETGGMTPAWGSEGKLLLAHEKEMVLNKSDTSNVLKIVDVARDMFNRFKSNFNLDAIRPATSPTLSPATYGDINVHIDRLNTDEAGAKDFFTRIASERRKKGY
ncbi:phage tail tape measure protein [Paenibacillus sp. QZ-Y1]|uniref:phage tail tape measure protein n=1 Tax=Paenibacillus sp. QZ-Y1 TaxID=3414511 RepID=UPI003F79C515